MRHIFLILLSILMASGAVAQTQQQEAMERIRSNDRYRWGEARSASYDEAREKAREDLIAKLKTVVVQESRLDNEQFSSSTVAMTVGSIENLSEIYYQDGNDYVAMVYVSEADLREAENQRRELISELIDLGKSQEQQLNISEALKYYTWALRALNTFGDKLETDTPAGRRNASAWLSNHIPAMLSAISFSIPAEKIAEDPGDYDRYLVNIDVTYDGKPVSMLDLAYFNGEKMVSPVHCKSGEGVLTFPNLDNMKSVQIRVIYDYPQEGRNYSPTIAALYQKGFKRLTFDQRAASTLPISIKKQETVRTESTPDVVAAPPTDAEAIADAAPMAKAPRKITKERTFTEDAENYIAIMKRVEEAIRNRNYESVAADFTPEGFRLFQMMMASGRVSVTKTANDYKIEESGKFVRGKGIPVAIKNGKHTSKENIVLRFDPEQNKISSVAYALTERAENDIFREGAQWSLPSRYSILQFMEDYQTAFALKRLDYIESIFSDDAKIIVGTMHPKAKKRFYGAGEMMPKQVESKLVDYRTFNKTTYIEKLKEDFRRKSFIQLIFEDTELAKAPVPEGLIGHEVIWIELKQSYNSSNYHDKGYLSLQINLRPDGSLINVRTWTPHFVPLDQLKQRFPVGND